MSTDKIQTTLITLIQTLGTLLVSLGLWGLNPDSVNTIIIEAVTIVGSAAMIIGIIASFLIDRRSEKNDTALKKALSKLDPETAMSILKK